MRFFMRVTSSLFVLLSITIFATVFLSTQYPAGIGTVSGLGFHNNNAGSSRVYFDLDSGIVLYTEVQTRPSSGSVMSFSNICSVLDDDGSLYHIRRSDRDMFELVHEQDDNSMVLASFESFAIFESCWMDDSKLYFVENIEESSVLHSINPVDGELATVLTVPELETGYIVISPDGNYLILSDYQDNAYATSTEPAYQHVIIDIAAETVIFAGQLTFVHPSRDSTTLLIGQDDETMPGTHLSLYDLESRTMQALNIAVSEPNTPFHYSPEIRWSPDSQHLATVNLNGNLLIVSLDGEQQAFSEGQLTPFQWSPDGRYLIANGFNSDLSLSAFIIDTHQGTIAEMASESGFQQYNMSLRWSRDSQYIAQFESLDSTTIGITIFDPQGQVVRNNMTITEADEVELQPYGFNWWNG